MIIVAAYFHGAVRWSPATTLLVGSNRAQQPARLLGRSTLHFPVLGEHLDDPLHDFAALLDVRVFTAAEKHCNLHFVIVLQEVDRLLDFEVDIVLSGFWANPDFLQLGLMLFAFIDPFAFLVLELAKVHDSANGRLRIRSNLDQVQTGFACLLERFRCCENPELFPVLVDDPDG